MLKLFFSIFVSLILGWTLHYLYSDTEQQKPQKTLNNPSVKTDCTDTYEVVEKVLIKYVPQTKIVYRDKIIQEKEDDNNSKDPFFIALEKKEFATAMGYYEEADEEKYPSYRSALYAYFEKMQVKNSLQAIDEMRTFIEIEPENKVFVFQLMTLFERKRKYNLALNLLLDLSYLIDFNEKQSVHTKIKSISNTYIKRLAETENFKALIDFLMTRINIGILNEFYSYELAKVYLKLKKYYESLNLLQELQYSDLYKERALALLSYVQLKLEEKEEYPIQIPLIRQGLHFLVKAKVEHTNVTLLVDTGASITTINTNKIQYLKVLKAGVLFHTAGGDIRETMYQAESFSIGETTLSNFKIAGSQFMAGVSDGLLGMNFLGNFKFKIDQREAILYLGKKNR